MGCRRVVFYAGLLIVLAAAIGIANDAVRSIATMRLYLNGQTAKGTVISSRAVRFSSRRSTIYVDVAFKTADGTDQRFTWTLPSRRARPLDGDTIQVRYDPASPASAREDSFGSFWFTPIIVAIVLVFPVSVVGLVLMWLTRFGASVDDGKLNVQRPGWIPRWFPP